MKAQWLNPVYVFAWHQAMYQTVFMMITSSQKFYELTKTYDAW